MNAHVWVVLRSLPFEGPGEELLEIIEDDMKSFRDFVFPRFLKHIEESGDAWYRDERDVGVTPGGTWFFRGELQHFSLDRRPVTRRPR